MKLITKRKKRGKLILKLVLLAFIIYVISLLVSQQMLVQDKKNKLQQINEQKVLQKIKNDDLENVLNSNNDTDTNSVERVAREFGYAKDGEIVFEVAKGNEK